MESDIILLVGHHYGISQLIDNKNKMASIFADFSAVKVVEVAPQQPGASKTNVKVDFQDMAVSFALKIICLLLMLLIKKYIVYRKC